MSDGAIAVCIITGRIAGDVDACGDCDPCSAARTVPEVVKVLLAEKETWRQKYGEAAAEIERLQALLDEVADATCMPLPDPGAHSWRAFYDAACTRLTRCANAARRREAKT